MIAGGYIMLDLKTLLDKIADFAMSAGVKLVISAVILIVGFKLIGLFVRKMKSRRTQTKPCAALPSALQTSR